MTICSSSFVNVIPRREPHLLSFLCREPLDHGCASMQIKIPQPGNPLFDYSPVAPSEGGESRRWYYRFDRFGSEELDLCARRSAP